MAWNRLPEVSRCRSAETIGRQHLAARLLAVSAGTALLLALVGLYGALAYSVTQRTQEIGIGRAPGAGQPGVLGLIMEQHHSGLHWLASQAGSLQPPR